MSLRKFYPLVWTAVFIASALGTFALMRGVGQPSPTDPARERIQALIDEADQLRRTLDESRRA
jgi:hypothetical protein